MSYYSSGSPAPSNEVPPEVRQRIDELRERVGRLGSPTRTGSPTHGYAPASPSFQPHGPPEPYFSPARAPISPTRRPPSASPYRPAGSHTPSYARPAYGETNASPQHHSSPRSRGHPRAPQAQQQHHRPPISPHGHGHGQGQGQRRALLVGINYRGTQQELAGCVNDVAALHQFLRHQGWPSDARHMRVLADDDLRTDDQLPTYDNIVAGLKWLVSGSRPGDSLFFGFSGHGVQLRDRSGEEQDGQDELLVTLDHRAIRDDELFDILVRPLPPGVTLTAVVDSCHAGTIFDLPYNYSLRGNYVDRQLWRPAKHTNQGGDVLLISASADGQESADANVGAGIAGGACINALLTVLAEHGPLIPLEEILLGIGDHLRRRGFAQTPSVSAAAELDLSRPLSLTSQGDPMQPLPRLKHGALNPFVQLPPPAGPARSKLFNPAQLFGGAINSFMGQNFGSAGQAVWGAYADDGKLGIDDAPELVNAGMQWETSHGGGAGGGAGGGLGQALGHSGFGSALGGFFGGGGGGGNGHGQGSGTNNFDLGNAVSGYVDQAYGHDAGNVAQWATNEAGW